MYKAKHMKYTRRRVTMPMLVLIAALCVAILVFPTSANDASASPDAVSGARSLATVIGEDELSKRDKLYLQFGDELEHRFINQGMYEPRSLEQTLDLGWRLLSILPRSELSRVSDKVLDKHYAGRE